MLYYAHVYSHLSYMSMVWPKTTAAELDQIQTLQNRCVKIITRKPHLTDTITLYDKDHLPVSIICNYQSLLNVFKIKHNMIKNNITTQQAHSIHTYPTRRKSDFYLEKPNSKLMENDFYYNAFRLFNELPDDIKRLPTISTFKIKIKEILLENWKNSYN